MKIFHITTWYPTQQNSKSAIWIQNHIDALKPLITDQYILHLEVQPSHRYKLHKSNLNKGLQRVLEIPTRSWFMIEMLSALLLFYYLMKLNARQYDLLNFHIAYPNLTYWHWIKKWIQAPIVITEHWSAYHFNFNLPQTKDLHRVKRIFRQNIPLLTVSNSLKRDITEFSNSTFPSYTLPNVVDSIFNFKDNTRQTTVSFFMVSQWKWPKDPFTVIKAFALYSTKTTAYLRIGGYGPQLEEIKILVQALGLGNYISFLGQLDAEEIAREFNQADAFLHCSEYETFAVVCAESLCCGCPVLASAVGGISEVVDESNGILLTSNNTDKWVEGLFDITEKQICREDISVESRAKFGKKIIGQKYFNILSGIVSGRKK